VLIGSGVGAAMVEMLIVPSLSLPIFAALFLLPILMVARSVTDYALPTVK
jgi:hypothetical protein